MNFLLLIYSIRHDFDAYYIKSLIVIKNKCRPAINPWVPVNPTDTSLSTKLNSL